MNKCFFMSSYFRTIPHIVEQICGQEGAVLNTMDRRTASGKRTGRKKAADRQPEMRKMIQLTVSLALFFTVFLGRNAFPELCGNLNAMIEKDTSFSEMLQSFLQDLSNQNGFLSTLEHLSASAVGVPKETGTPQSSEALNEEKAELVQIMALSQMPQHGLAYYREHGLLRKLSDTVPEPSQPQEPIPAPKVVTAVAQAYNSQGEALPRNVSYQYYELGLEKTTVPVKGSVTSGFEYRVSPITGQKEFHLALDIAAAKGTAVAAFADGVVRYIGESDEFGLYLMIDHANAVATFYAHCSELLVHKGDTVHCGDTVALVGNTGNATGYHLHFTIEKDDVRLDPSYYVAPEA